jgi:hypothetical protein
VPDALFGEDLGDAIFINCGKRVGLGTFAADRPGFAFLLQISIGETTERHGFIATDVTPARPDGTDRRGKHAPLACG